MLTDLQPSVQRSLDGDTLAGMDPVGGDGGDEGVQLVLLLLQLLHQALDGPLGEALVLSALPVAHEAVDDAEAGVIAAGRVHRHDAATTGRHRKSYPSSVCVCACFSLQLFIQST